MSVKPTTIHDVAGALGMHKSTVSLALSGKGNISVQTRQRVLLVARELGYEPNPLAQRLAHGHSNGTVCLFSGLLDVGLATEKILLVQRALNAHGMDVPIYTCYDPATDNGEAQATQLRQLCRLRPRAIICAAQMVSPSIYQELETYQNNGGLVVSYDTPIDFPCDRVIFDREDNAYLAARHLLEKGHRDIGIGMSRLNGPVVGTKADPQLYRMRGFQRALTEFGATMRPEWSFRSATYEKGGAELARQFLALKERPTALTIVNDYVALAFMVELLRAGVRVPEDVSVVSHDNQPVAVYCPVQLTSMTHPTEKIAEAVVTLLLERINGIVPPDTPPRTVTISGDLICRESVAALAPTPERNV